MITSVTLICHTHWFVKCDEHSNRLVSPAIILTNLERSLRKYKLFENQKIEACLQGVINNQLTDNGVSFKCVSIYIVLAHFCILQSLHFQLVFL